ncbi:MAG TPA: FAD-dependent oxidoreductase [Pseudolysinimonas sp.]|nr:FAD-dependent oxidoreductase [Pseudolysinimonas sp.]
MTDAADYVVVGAGLAGAAAAWRLAAAGRDVVLLEQFEPGHRHGSSHGSARIFRYAYPQELYAGLVVDARRGWDELAEQSGQDLITTTGALDFGANRNAVELAGVLTRVGVEHELLSADEAGERWPHLAFDSPVLWHPSAGVIDADRAVATMVELARSFGANVLSGWQVASIRRANGRYQVASEHGDVLDAAHVVVAAGGWLPDLLAELPLPPAFLSAFPALTVRQEQAFHFPYRDELAAWPTFVYKSPEIQTYGLPGGRDAGNAGQKVAEFNGGRVIRSAAAQDGVVDPSNRERVTRYVERHLPGLVPEPYAETTCLFTSTPTEDFVIDSIDGLTVVSPCSGHGAKFAPSIGRWAADAAMGTGPVPDAFRVR